MVSICVYTKPEVLLHKQGKLKDDPDFSRSGDYVWTLPSLTKGFVDKIYFATKGFIRGYFEVFECDGKEINFCCRDWYDVEPIPQKPFQGYKYMDVKEESK